MYTLCGSYTGCSILGSAFFLGRSVRVSGTVNYQSYPTNLDTIHTDWDCKNNGVRRAQNMKVPAVCREFGCNINFFFFFISVISFCSPWPLPTTTYASFRSSIRTLIPLETLAGMWKTVHVLARVSDDQWTRNVLFNKIQNYRGPSSNGQANFRSE